MEKKILHIIARIDPKEGGVSQAVRTIVPELARLKTHNEVISLDSPQAPFINNHSFITHAIGPSKGPWAYNKVLIPWLKSNLLRFDIVVLHGLWLYQGYALLKAIKFLEKKGNITAPSFYIMPHGMLDPYFQRASGRILKAIRNWVYWQIIESKLIKSANGVLFTSKAELLQSRITFKSYRPKQEIVVGLGVDDPPLFNKKMTEEFYKVCPELANEPYLLFLGRIDKKKGIDLLISAYIQIAEKFALEKRLPKLVIAGPGIDTAYGQKLKAGVLSKDIIRNRIFFPGMLEGNAKWGAFYNSEVFILPSHQENFGIAVVEALACKSPVLISKQVNIWKEIEECGGGFAADDSISGTMNLLEQWYKMPLKTKLEMKEKARVTYVKHFQISCNTLRLKEAIARQ